MGAYLNIYLKESIDPEGTFDGKFDKRGLERKDILAKKLNKLWKEFANEEEEKEYNQNFYDDKCGYTLHFIEYEDLLSSAKYFQSENRTDLGFKPKMTDEQLVKQYLKTFKYDDIGSTSIKISGEHYCCHRLEKAKQFINLLEVKKLIYINKETIKELDEYIDYNEKIVTSRYCNHCIDLAKKNDMLAPKFNKEITDKFNYKSSIKLEYDTLKDINIYNKKIIKDNIIINKYNYIIIFNYINEKESYDDKKINQILDKIYDYLDFNDKKSVNKFCKDNNIQKDIFINCANLCINKKLPLFGNFPLFEAKNNKNVAFSPNEPESEKYNLLLEASNRIKDDFKFSQKIKKEALIIG